MKNMLLVVKIGSCIPKFPRVKIKKCKLRHFENHQKVPFPYLRWARIPRDWKLGYTFYKWSFSPPHKKHPSIIKTFRYLKWRYPHLCFSCIEIYMASGKPQPPKTAEKWGNIFYLHFRYTLEKQHRKLLLKKREKHRPFYHQFWGFSPAVRFTPGENTDLRTKQA